MGIPSTDDGEQLVNELLTAGVIEPSSDGDRLGLGTEFAEHVETTEATLAELDDDGFHEALRDVLDEEREVDAMLDVADHDMDLLAQYVALGRHGPDSFDHEDRLRVMTVFDALHRSPPPDHGAPEAFMPVHGDRLPFLLRMYPEAVVYIWLDDCPDCDEMRATLDDTFDETPADLALLSVFGPDCPRLLQEEYDVPGGPATLFVHDGAIDSCLYGAQYEGVLESEIRTLRDLSE